MANVNTGNVPWYAFPLPGNLVTDRRGCEWEVIDRQFDGQMVTGCTLRRVVNTPVEEAAPQPAEKSNVEVARATLRSIAETAGNPQDRITAAQILLTCGGGE